MVPDRTNPQALSNGDRIVQAEQQAERALLIVASSTDLRDLLARALARWGWAAAQVTTADAALAALRAQHHDALLIDLCTLGPSARDLVHHVRRDADPALARMAVMAHAPYAGAGEMALAAGADDYLVAPCNPSHLLSRLAACVVARLRLR